MKALDALFMQNIYADDLIGSAKMDDYLDSYIESMQGMPEVAKFSAEHDIETPIPNKQSWACRYSGGGELRTSLIKWLQAGLTYYVDPRMFQLITAAAESMPQETLLPRDLPSDFGFMWIPGGLGVIDIRGEALKYNAVQWATVGGQVKVTWLTDKNDLTDSTNIRMRERGAEKYVAMFPRLSPGGFSEMEFGKPLPIVAGPDFLVPPEMSLKVIYGEGPGGETKLAWAFSEGYSAEELQSKFEIKVRTDPTSRWLLAAWRLMQQTVTSVEEEKAPRQLRRQLERKNLPASVSVIALRHKAARGEGDTDIEWSHRWLVRGHWRNQKVKEDGEWTTRLVWIHPYVKGPEDKPLLIRDHVYALVR